MKNEDFPSTWEAPDFKRKQCPACKSRNGVPFFYIGQKKESDLITNWICFLCLDNLHYKHHIKYDDIHELSLEEVQKYINKELEIINENKS